MSTGNFITARYAASYDDANIHPIRVQPETLGLQVTIAGVAVTNTQAVGALNNPISAVVSRGRRSKGLNARLIRIKFGDEPPEDYLANSPLTLPALNPALLSAINGATGTYLGAAITVLGTSPEVAR